MYLINNLKNEFKLIRRDIILIALAVFVVYMAVVLKFLLPWLNDYLKTQGFLPGKAIMNSLSHYYPIILSFLIIYTGAMLSGAIFGFLILTEKDENTLKAILVSPISPRQYIQGRIIVSSAVAFLIIMFIFYVVDLKLLSFAEMIIISLGGASTAPLIMLFLAILADSKLQGLSYSKFLSFGGFLIIISWFLKQPQQLIFRLFPPYWISKAYWTALDNQRIWYVYAFTGIILQVVAAYFLAKQFIKKVYKKI